MGMLCHSNKCVHFADLENGAQRKNTLQCDLVTKSFEQWQFIPFYPQLAQFLW